MIKDITEFTENVSSTGFEKEWERKKRLFARKKKIISKIIIR